MTEPAPLPGNPSDPKGLLWYVAHTRPRCEKKLASYCRRESLAVTLPCYRVVHKYRGPTPKTIAFEKPLFPGYVFLELLAPQRQRVHQSDCVAKLLVVVDQVSFVEQLQAVLQALETNLPLRLAPQVSEGQKVRITQGPLCGLEGWVERRSEPGTVLLRIDFIGQAAAVQLGLDDFELI
jgi:transcriptional antiterminator RfaH